MTAPPNALSAEEWAMIRELSQLGISAYPDPNGPQAHRIAALALYGQPFGFTQEMVEALSRALDNAERWVGTRLPRADRDEMADVRIAREALQRIQVLLPPEPDGRER